MSGAAPMSLWRWLCVLLSPVSLETTGDPCSATSAAPQGCMGQGMGSMPMSPSAQPVPAENVPAQRTTAKGIVTRMGQDLQGLGGTAIEPGAEGIRPASSVCNRPGWLAVAAFLAPLSAAELAAHARRVGAAAAPSARKRSAVEGAAAAVHTPPSNTGVNKTRSGHGG